jgi:hypothetical protein
MGAFELMQIKLRLGLYRRIPRLYEIMRRLPPTHGLPKMETSAARRLREQEPVGTIVERILYRNPSLRPTESTLHVKTKDKSYRMATEVWQKMQKGLDETAAIRQVEAKLAMAEEDAFSAFQTMVTNAYLHGERIPVKDRDALPLLERWRVYLAKKPYLRLNEGERGLLDRFLTSQVLGWTEVETQERMKNIAWVFYLLKLRSALFPQIEPSLVRSRNQIRAGYKEEVL